MSGVNLILIYSWRLVRRQWRRFLLPFFSLLITAVILTLILLLTNASALLLSSQARDLLGGDVVLESITPIDSQEFWSVAGLEPELGSNQLSFSGTILSKDLTAPFSIQAVDANFPVYGEFVLREGSYQTLTDNEILLDAAGAERLVATVGDIVSFGEREFTVAGIIITEPTSLFGGFRFLPRAIMSLEGFAATGVDPELLRAEYIYAAKFSAVGRTDIEQIRAATEVFSGTVEVNIAGENRQGLQRGLRTVTDFLVVAVLITAVLAAVNVYASTLYLVTVERKSLAILLALGLTKRRLVVLLGLALFYVVLVSGVIGVSLGGLLFLGLSSLIASLYFIILPTPAFLLYALLCLVLIATIALSSFIPAVRKTLALNPKQILIGGGDNTTNRLPLRSLFFVTLLTLLPLVFLASFLLSSVVTGGLVILATAIGYVVIAGLFSALLALAYKMRHRFGFYWRSVISQKRSDGLFGVVSFTSLFIALTALSTLSLLQISLQQFLSQDLALTVPTTYVLDIQPSQKDLIQNQFPALELFSNIGARLISIDEVMIQDALALGDTTIDRELGREFNITVRSELADSETVTSGVWSDGRAGEVSVDEEFADRANITLGSTITFSIQGFPVSGTVTSLRSTDSRSGLPFFYFVLSPADAGQFPSVYFGYSYFDKEEQQSLGRFLAANAPNVSMLETQAIGPLIIRIVSTLLLMVLVVTLPPLLIATLLIATLVVSSYSARRREGARLRALGATKRNVLLQYLTETISLTLVAALSAYVLSILITFVISTYFLSLDSFVWFDLELVIGLGLIVLLVGMIGLYLFKSDTMPLRELLSYGDNS